MQHNTIYEYIISEEANWKTARVPITGSKDWNMHEHIERCTNVANGWFHQGKNDGLRPYNDIVTPIINVAFRLEGFDVKDIVPFVNEAKEYHKSFLIKKFHPQWARTNELDTLIDDVVETSVIYDLALLKKVGKNKIENVPLQTIAFCDQTDVLIGPIGLKHQYSVSDLLEFKGKWDDDKIDEVIIMAKYSKKVPNANDQEVKTPGKNIEVYEVHGLFPESWLKQDGDPEKYVPQVHFVNYYINEDGKKNGITLFKGLEKKSIFRALKIDRVKSHGRACGKSIVETLFEPQVWNNYDAIKIKKMLDAAVNLLQTDSDEFGNQKISDLKENTILKHETGKPITRVDMNLQNMPTFTNHQLGLENSARILGSAAETALGLSPTSGTPLGTSELVSAGGQGIHEYRQGKIATFFADILYRDWILNMVVEDMDGGKKFSEELSLEEMQEVADRMSQNETEEKMADLMFKGVVVTSEMKDMMLKTSKDNIIKRGSRGFFEVVQGELKELPIDVYVNIKGKQRNMAKNADSITKIIQTVIANPQAFQQIPGAGKALNELLEESGMSAIDYTQITTPPANPVEQPQQQSSQPLPISK